MWQGGVEESERAGPSDSSGSDDHSRYDQDSEDDLLAEEKDDEEAVRDAVSSN